MQQKTFFVCGITNETIYIQIKSSHSQITQNLLNNIRNIKQIEANLL